MNFMESVFLPAISQLSIGRLEAEDLRATWRGLRATGYCHFYGY
ncbi:hypothetical protein [Dyadobacter sp.]